MAEGRVDIHDALVLGGMAPRRGPRGFVVDMEDDGHGIRVFGRPDEAE